MTSITHIKEVSRLYCGVVRIAIYNPDQIYRAGSGIYLFVLGFHQRHEEYREMRAFKYIKAY